MLLQGARALPWNDLDQRCLLRDRLVNDRPQCTVDVAAVVVGTAGSRVSVRADGVTHRGPRRRHHRRWDQRTTRRKLGLDAIEGGADDTCGAD